MWYRRFIDHSYYLNTIQVNDTLNQQRCLGSGQGCYLLCLEINPNDKHGIHSCLWLFSSSFQNCTSFKIISKSGNHRILYLSKFWPKIWIRLWNIRLWASIWKKKVCVVFISIYCYIILPNMGTRDKIFFSHLTQIRQYFSIILYYSGLHCN